MRFAFPVEVLVRSFQDGDKKLVTVLSKGNILELVWFFFWFPRVLKGNYMAVLFFETF